MERLKPETAEHLLAGAWGVSLLATVGSLTYSGIGFLAIDGLGLPPCELCWYQRILMYPLTAILGYAFLRREVAMERLALGFSVFGTVLAAFHSLIQWYPFLEPGQCRVGVCTAILYKVAGLSIPNQSFLAFAAITTLLVLRRRLFLRPDSQA